MIRTLRPTLAAGLCAATLGALALATVATDMPRTAAVGQTEAAGGQARLAARLPSASAQDATRLPASSVARHAIRAVAAPEPSLAPVFATSALRRDARAMQAAVTVANSTL